MKGTKQTRKTTRRRKPTNKQADSIISPPRRSVIARPKTKGSSHWEPNFFNVLYTVEPCTPDNTLVLSYDDFFDNNDPAAKPNLDTFHFCNKHRFHHLSTDEVSHIHKMLIWEGANCQVIPFKKFNRAFFVSTPLNANLLYPPPVVYRDKSLQFFISSLVQFRKHATLQNSTAIRMNRLFAHDSYQQFFKDYFTGGTMKEMTSGKESEIRNKVLAIMINGFRLTVTINHGLPANLISVNRRVFEMMNSHTGMVIINRPPSINSLSISIQQVAVHADDTDETVHVNIFAIRGMHADQDGDEVTMTWIGDIPPLAEPGMELKRATCEMQRVSHHKNPTQTTTQQSRYQLASLLFFYAHLYDEELTAASSLWRALVGNNPYEKMQHLSRISGSCLLRNECNDLFDMLMKINNVQKSGLTTRELGSDGRHLRQIVESGAKGSLLHLQKLSEKMFAGGSAIDDGVKHFNGFVNASTQMSTQGTHCFHCLYAFHSVHQRNGDIICNGRILVKNVHLCDIGASMLCNVHAVQLILDRILIDFP